MKFMTISYAIKIKRIFQEVEPNIESIVKSTLKNKNKEKILNSIYPYAEKAFQEGVLLGNFLSGNKVRNDLTGREKKKLFEKFIISLTTANKIFELKVESLTEKGTSKYDIFLKEYISTISKATNRLIIDAGAQGVRRSVRK